jgi:hypothetical protein
MALSEDDPLLLEALKVFDEGGYDYYLKLGASMVWVTSKSGKKYAFYPTTGRWAPYGRSRPSVHYRSKGAQDFIDRFIKPSDEANEAIEEDRKNIIPDGVKTGNLREFLEFVYEQFEDGLTFNQIYYGIVGEHRQKARKEMKK